MGRGARGGTVSIHVHAPKMHVERTCLAVPRWCFGCRTRSTGLFSLWVITDWREDWYGPHWSYRCGNCGGDHRLGFGWEWLDGAPGPREDDYALQDAHAV